MPDASGPIIDSFGRRISHVRMSRTDRCGLRCRCGMADTMAFVPRSEEVVELADTFFLRAVRRIRLTGGEPQVGKGRLVGELGRRVASSTS